MSRRRMLPRSLRLRSPLTGLATLTLATYVACLMFTPPLSAHSASAQTTKNKTATVKIALACSGDRCFYGAR